MINNFLKNNKTFKNKGYSIVEILFYIAIFSAFGIILINSLVTMTKSFKQTRISWELSQSSAIIEKISREIKQAHSVNYISTSDLILGSKDTEGNDKTVQFTLSGSNIIFLENGTLIGNLNTPNISIQSLNFEKVTTAKGSAVKFLVTIKSNNDPSSRNEDFYNTLVLRGDY